MKGPTYSKNLEKFLCHICDHFRLMRLQDSVYANIDRKYMLVCTHPEMTHEAGLSYLGYLGETPSCCPYMFMC